MSVSTFVGLETTLQGLLAEQYALDTTSHNIANANTPGYSRQTVDLVASDPLQVGEDTEGPTELGTGVQVEDISRIRDSFLDTQYRAQATQVGYQQERSQQLDQIQSGLDEPSDDGLSAQLSQFWQAWSNVANDPSSQAARQALVDQADNLTSAFQTLSSQFATDKSQAAAQYASLTGPQGQVEQLASQIASLNQTIEATEENGSQPNDLLDQRDDLLDQLSNLGQVSITNLSNGSIQVQFGDAAKPLVDDTTVNWPQTLTSPGGQLGALLDFSDTGGVIDTYSAQLNAAAKTLADSVNALESNGSPPGVDFFNYTPGSEASTLTVAVTPSQVVTSTTGAPDANDIALQISQLQGGAADTAYSNLVSQIGSDDQDASTESSNASALLSSIDSNRQSASGVSLDEEMANLERFQQGYEASARAMNTINSTLNTLINQVGTNGI